MTIPQLQPLLTKLTRATLEDSFGTIQPPPGVDKYIDETASGDIGLIFFLSRMIFFATVVAGVWVFANLLTAGYLYLGSKGSADVHAKVSSLITMSVVGLVLIISVYTIAGILGLLIFGDASFILNPKIEGPSAFP
jgi:hypothetical protein